MVQFGAQIVQDVTDRNVLALSLDAIELAQKFLSLLGSLSFDFETGKQQLMFNCLLLTETFLDDRKRDV